MLIPKDAKVRCFLSAGVALVSRPENPLRLLFSLLERVALDWTFDNSFTISPFVFFSAFVHVAYIPKLLQC